MDIERIKKTLSESHSLADSLGMQFLSTPDEDSCIAKMAVNESNCQPYGYLSGGASLALAETLAGVGSAALCPDNVCVGINVSGHHVKAVKVGDTVTAKATIVQNGRALHVWNVELTDSQGDLVSTVVVTNYVINH
ncbi:MAG: PaaI family thioesterase [Prevotellaceae bacterium]|nr:PaaI family thioesterase [Prevotellaceae bacterium]MDD5992483.1 PaaI family thioesterase [Prevotellaceae bacterium]MDD6008082.1 PaaI family thioesterase [Prevotellaceae bacterium]MDD6111847.1 PaaI family thioesterase [Prevotellaceae bacterium]MDD6779505.1 PaaI family thioesterase [Prevotellaceae bacterium]